MATKIFKKLNDASIKETWTPILEGYGIYVDAVLSMITFDVKEQDTRFEISVNT
jgi:hypothetical protein